ncbi:hypothetical protein GCM10007924_32590 [Sneathiella chinensis]|uniref:TNase-like domain-containing protein n=2 Tax=Sneathiella chinensis TaxID=349750 RepID=A0ABQ5U9Q1_9PROT|nr:hypothetical protein GCM10007924_32590 [Sneathiella chinensis]
MGIGASPMAEPLSSGSGLAGHKVKAVGDKNVSLYGVRIGEAGARQLQQLVPREGWEVEGHLFEKIDFSANRYGELHGRLLHSGIGWVQHYLVRKGLGVVSGAGPYPPALRTALQKAEDQARQDQVGIWAAHQPEQRQDHRILLQEGAYQVVEGQVTAVKKNRSWYYLNFGEDWRTDFTAAISTRYLTRFKEAGLDPEGMHGKRVRLRGKVRPYNGPFMELVHPEQVQVLADQ